MEAIGSDKPVKLYLAGMQLWSMCVVLHYSSVCWIAIGKNKNEVYKDNSTMLITYFILKPENINCSC